MHEKRIDVITETIESKSALIFDFDGVLADSVNIKTEAFAEMYKQYGEEVTNKVIAHHLENGGMSRFEKFSFYHKNFLDIELDENELKSITNSFSQLVKNKVINSPEIKGVNFFLKHFCLNNKLSFVNSATPKVELEEIIKKRKMDMFFTSIYGSPNSKLSNLERIFSKYNITPEETIFFGDAMVDFEASQACGCYFVGIGQDIQMMIKSIDDDESIKCGFLKDFRI